MDTLEINDQFVVLLFEDKTGGAWCKKVTDGKRVVIATWTRNHDDIAFRRKAAEWLFSDGGYTMNIAQLARMKDEKLVDSYTTA